MLSPRAARFNVFLTALIFISFGAVIATAVGVVALNQADSASQEAQVQCTVAGQTVRLITPFLGVVLAAVLIALPYVLWRYARASSPATFASMALAFVALGFVATGGLGDVANAGTGECVRVNGSEPATADISWGGNDITSLGGIAWNTDGVGDIGTTSVRVATVWQDAAGFTNGFTVTNASFYTDQTRDGNEAVFWDFIQPGAYATNMRDTIRLWQQNAVGELTPTFSQHIRFEDGTDGAEYATAEWSVMRNGALCEIMDFDTNSRVIAWNDCSVDINMTMEADDIVYGWFYDATAEGRFWIGESTTTPDGNLGDVKFTVHSDLGIGDKSSPPANTIAVFEDGGYAFLNVVAGNTNNAGIYLGVNSDPDKARIINNDNISGDPLEFYQDNALRMSLYSTGPVLPDGDWLQMGGGAPTGTDCDAAAEEGRIWVDTTNGLMYICDQTGASTGWATVLDFSS